MGHCVTTGKFSLSPKNLPEQDAISSSGKIKHSHFKQCLKYHNATKQMLN